ncbi:MAG: hypothetical protein DI601_23445, partial [Azospirillum brasilense]
MNRITQAAGPPPGGGGSAPDPVARDCDLAWARHRGECYPTSSAVNDWEAYHRALLSEEARL